MSKTLRFQPITVRAFPQSHVQLGLRRHHHQSSYLSLNPNNYYMRLHQHRHHHHQISTPAARLCLLVPQLHHNNPATHQNPTCSSPRHHQRDFHCTPQLRTTANDDAKMVADGLENEDWKSKPPYRTSEANQHFEKKFTAHCHCGRVKYWLSREKPLAAKFCHCVDCQSLHGAPFQWAAIFEKTDLHFENGAEGLAFYNSGDKQTHHRLPTKVSCAYCHAPIMDEGRNMVLMFPAIIKFGDPEHKKAFDPQCHIFYSQRVVDLPDGKPKWSGLDNSSELIKDVQKHEMQSVVGHPKVEKADE